MRKENLFIGLGSSILADQSIVLKIMEMLQDAYTDVVNFESALVSSLDLVELYSSCKRMIVLDSIHLPDQSLGELTFSDLSTPCGGLHTENYHDSSICETIEVAKLLGIPVPEQIVLLTINVKDIYSLSEEYCNELQEELPVLYSRIDEVVNDFFQLRPLVVEEIV